MKIYSYDAGPPTEGADQERLEHQLRAAHRYRNALAAIERNRRVAVQATRRLYSPDFDAATAEYERLDAAVAAAVAALHKERSKTKRGGAAPDPVKAEIKALKAARKAAWARVKEARELLASDGQYKAAEHAIGHAAEEAVRAERAATEAFWGSYLLVEQRLDAARKQKGEGPRFLRYAGEGRVGMQLQGGLSLQEALSCEDTRLRIALQPQRDPSTRRGRHQRAQVSLRVGSQGRAPIFITFEALLHRPIPADAVIKWAWLKKQRVGTKWQYAFQLSLDTAERRAHGTAGAVAVDLGWRAVNGLRVGYYVGSDGEHGPISVPEGALYAMTHPDELHSIRDKNFDAMRERLRRWLAGDDRLPESLSQVPDWLSEATATLPQWRSATRLAYLTWRWRDQRFEGDREIYAALEAWRKQDKHLLEWEVNERNRGKAQREDHYRNIAAQLARRYRVLVLEDFDLTSAARAPEPEDDTPGATKGLRLTQRLAAPSILRMCLEEAFAVTVKVPAKDTTRTCHVCSHIETWDQAKYTLHTCSSCGALWDQDHNAAVNILRAAGAWETAKAVVKWKRSRWAKRKDRPAAE